MTSPHAVDPPREGQLLPAFTLPRAGGGELRVRSYRGRRALCVIFLHGVACVACREYLVEVLDRYAAYAEEDGEVVVVVPDPAVDVTALRADLALPFPVAIDAGASVCRRYRLEPGEEAAVMLTDRYGAPRLWHVAPRDHGLPEHEHLIAELRYLAMTCSAGCAVPLWDEEDDSGGRQVTAAARVPPRRRTDRCGRGTARPDGTCR
jgi:peroxiredoxin